MLENPNAFPINATVTYYRDSGIPLVKTYALRAASRTNILVNVDVPNSAVSMKVESENTLYAERAMYSRLDGTASHGIAAPSRTWYFAEGATVAPYNTWLRLLNPNAISTRVTVTFLTESGAPVVRLYSIAPTTRLNVYANAIVPNAAIATTVVSDLPIVAERTMSFGTGSHGSTGVTQPGRIWYLAEGYTGGGFDTWILLANPGSSAAQATVTFLQDNGAQVTRTFTVAARARLNVYATAIVPNAAFSTQVVSSQPIVVERAMYFGPANARGGHNSEAASAPANEWHLAEGYTGGGFDTYILIMNPNDRAANVSVRFLREAAPAVTQSISVAPNSRYTIWVNPLYPGAAFSTVLSGDQPIVVERAMYFNNFSGGTDALGVPAVGAAKK